MKTALVTGGNRGIGKEVCRQLDRLGYTVILCARSLSRGMEARTGLSNTIQVAQLDVTSEHSILALADLVESKFGTLDLLINNAGLGTSFVDREKSPANAAKDFVRNNFGGAVRAVSKITARLKSSSSGISGIGASNIPITDVQAIMETNFYGPWRMIQAFLPLLQQNEEGRIINVSSGLGELASLDGKYPGYSMSKASLNALTLMFSRVLKEQKIAINAVCPGWVRTDMGGPNAPRSVEEGADTIVWLAEQSIHTSGKFFRDRKEIDW